MGARIRERFPPTKNAVNGYAPRAGAKRPRQPVGENPRTESATAACGCRRVRAPAGSPTRGRRSARGSSSVGRKRWKPHLAVGRTHLDLSAPLEDRSRASEPLPRGCKSPAQKSDKPAATDAAGARPDSVATCATSVTIANKCAASAALPHCVRDPRRGDPRKGTCGRSNAGMTRVRPNLGAMHHA